MPRVNRRGRSMIRNDFSHCGWTFQKERLNSLITDAEMWAGDRQTLKKSRTQPVKIDGEIHWMRLDSKRRRIRFFNPAWSNSLSWSSNDTTEKWVIVPPHFHTLRHFSLNFEIYSKSNNVRSKLFKKDDFWEGVAYLAMLLWNLSEIWITSQGVDEFKNWIECSALLLRNILQITRLKQV
jgi:hypothetical protein